MEQKCASGVPEHPPLIAILMAVYEPNLDWLREQLYSLNAQTYPNLVLAVREDCSPTVSFERISRMVAECITAFPYTLRRNERNMGSNGTFQLLTEEGEGAYFSYCDQDDIWFPHRIADSFARMREIGGLLTCGDVVVIDGEGRQTADSIRAVRPHHVFQEGTGLEGTLLYRNFVIGCTMLVDSAFAKSTLPFAATMVHDHYLALCAARAGCVGVCPRPLIAYRIHGGNQTGVLHDVVDLESYYRHHLHPFTLRMEELAQRGLTSPQLARCKTWAQAREAHFFREKGSLLRLWQLRDNNPKTTLFELVALGLPSFLFRSLVRTIQLGKL